MNNKSVFKTDKTVCLSVCLPIYPSINLNKIKSRIVSLCNFHWQCFTKSQKVYVNFWKVFWNAIVGNDFVLLSCMANKSSIGPPSYGGLYKITAVSLSLSLSVSLSLSISLAFFWGMAHCFCVIGGMMIDNWNI